MTRNRTGVDKTSLFCCKCCVALLTEPGYLMAYRSRAGEEGPGQGLRWKNTVDSATSLLGPLEPPCMPGTVTFLHSFLGPWLERMWSWANFVICAWVTSKPSRHSIWYLGVGVAIWWGFCFQRNSLFPPFSVLSDCITIRYNVKLVFTIKTRVPHGNSFPLVFLGKKRQW